jgi:phenylalanyl-tRNA synthetase beta chain
MKISYNWLKQYIPTDLSPEQIGEVLTAIGLEVEAIEKVESIPGGLAGVVVGEVLTCEKHPDADRLRVTTVNLGSGEPVQIVCGAPNVAAGQKVLVATIGTTLHPVSGEPLTIKKGKIRGQESHGMICAEDELGLGQSHDGIMILDAAVNAGTTAADLLELQTDYCLEIGLTPNRTDAISHYGVARDLAAALHQTNPSAWKVASLPTLLPSLTPSTNEAVRVRVEDTDAAPRYATLVLKNVKVGPSPKWLRERLQTIGLRSINNVVDITNFLQHECGQPLHAFDATQIEGNTIVVRKAQTGEKLTTLDGTERTLHTDDLVICDSNKPMCLAGIFGGLTSGVNDNTTTIVLESAWFNAVTIRKAARRHALNTDSSFRFERGTDPNMVMWALQRAAQLICEEAGATVASVATDHYPTSAKPAEVKLTWKRTATLIGQELPQEDVKRILHDLDFSIASEDEAGLQLVVPTYRVEVTREADVIEEVLRIYGYNNIDFPSGLRTSLSYAPAPDAEAIQNKLADFLTGNGFSEMMSMSLTKAKYTALVNHMNYGEESAVSLLNPLSGDLANMRQTLLFGTLEAIGLNQNFRNSDLRVYEFGKEYRKINGEYHEEMHLAIALTGRRFPENWNNTNDQVSFTDLKAVLENLVRICGLQNTFMQASNHPFYTDALDLMWSSGRKDQAICIASLGAVQPSLLKSFDVKQQVWFADINWPLWLKALPTKRIQYNAPEKYPAVRRDLSLLLNTNVRFAELEQVAFDAERKLLREVGLFDVYEGKNLESGKKSYALRFVLQDSAKTMTDDQVEKAMGRILQQYQEKLGAVLRG